MPVHLLSYTTSRDFTEFSRGKEWEMQIYSQSIYFGSIYNYHFNYHNYHFLRGEPGSLENHSAYI